MFKLNSYQQPKREFKEILLTQLWRSVSFLVFKNSPQFLYGFRRVILRAFGAKIGKKVLIRPSVRIEIPWNLQIDDFCWIGDEVYLYSIDKIIIGENTVISQRSNLCTASHNYYSKNFETLSSQIKIGKNCWVASDVFISMGVTINSNVIVGSRTSVYKNLESNYLYTGNPARAIKSI